MNDKNQTYILSKEYAFILFPLFLMFLTWISIPPFSRFQYWAFPLICVWAWYHFFFTAFRVELIDNNKILLKSLLKTSRIEVKDILWIKESIGFLVIRHSKGKNYITTMMNNISGLKSSIMAINPNIETKYAVYWGGEWK
jgi:hypothetical protein